MRKLRLKATLSKETPAKVFSCEFCEILKAIYFRKHLQTAVFVYCQANINLEKSLLVRDLLLIRLIYVRNKKNAFDYNLLTKNAYKFKMI